MKHFIQEHREDDVRQLALQANRYPDIDIPYALTQIAGWQSIRNKVPTWAACSDIIYPSHLPLEQCSSEVAALYKYGVVSTSGHTDSLVDLTGGFGIDCWFMSRAFQRVIYVERQEELAKIAEHNFNILNNNCNSSFVNCQSEEWLHECQRPVSWFFLDPARRDEHGGKTVAISDCEPDVCALEEILVEKASKIMVKLSPMLDLNLACHQLKHIQEAHIVAIDNECKELLLILSKDCESDADNMPIFCVNIRKSETQVFVFCKQEEKFSTCQMAESIGHYLYEPNASIMKAGAFRCICQRYELKKLQANSHLYTSNEYLADYPGRIFEVEAISDFGKKNLKTFLTDLHKANLTVRNFPASVADLRKRFHLQEGGDIYLFATMLHPQQKILIRCRKV
ncbi:MAG: SAM-dependent methyltransferase [Bacteroidaceae bacterium]|nr:SAM-dependent methyltransferase [Bacteroidaceae bacterium]